MSGPALPPTIELCSRIRDGLPCLGRIHRSGVPEIACCTACGKRDAGRRYVPVLSDEESAEVQRELSNTRAILEAYKAHHARFHADCNIDGPPAPPRTP